MLYVALVLAVVVALPALTLTARLRAPYGFILWPVKLFGGALAPFFTLIAAAVAVFCLIVGNSFAAILCILAALLYASYVRRVTAPQPRLERGFGDDWWKRIPPEMGRLMLTRRWNWKMALPPAFKEPRVERDIPFCTIPGTQRRLLCDVWQPPAGVKNSGLAIVYLHGSAWSIGDKDFYTRPLFSYLANQGHVIMDAAYRMSPETDMFGMIGDTKRAIAWMKDQVSRYGADPERIVAMGASAGGHLSLLHAFAPHHPELTPEDVRGKDLSVRAVASYYGPTDLVACYQHTNQQRLKNDPLEIKAPTGIAPSEHERRHPKFANAGKFSIFMGGRPDGVPEVYELASPVSHVHASCPPVFLAQGEHDLITPVEATRELSRLLREVGVPVVNVVLPYTDHGFDLALPHYSPPAQVALFYLERFLALMV